MSPLKKHHQFIRTHTIKSINSYRDASVSLPEMQLPLCVRARAGLLCGLSAEHGQPGKAVKMTPGHWYTGRTTLTRWPLGSPEHVRRSRCVSPRTAGPGWEPGGGGGGGGPGTPALMGWWSCPVHLPARGSWMAPVSLVPASRAYCRWTGITVGGKERGCCGRQFAAVGRHDLRVPDRQCGSFGALAKAGARLGPLSHREQR